MPDANGMTPAQPESLLQRAEDEAKNLGEEILQEGEKILGDVGSALAPIFEGIVTSELANLATNAGDTKALGQSAVNILEQAVPQVEAASIKASAGDLLTALGAAAKKLETATAPIPITGITPPPPPPPALTDTGSGSGEDTDNGGSASSGATS